MTGEQDWYYMHGERQLGPVSAEDLQQLASGGSITAETQLWTEGLEEWVPAAKVEGLFPDREAPHPHLILGSEAQTAHPLAGEILPAQVADPAAPTGAQGSASPVAGAATPPIALPGSDYPSPGAMKASFGKLLTFPILAILSLVGGFLLLKTRIDSPFGGSQTDAWEFALENLGIVLVATILFGLCFLIFIILKMTVLHRAWQCLQFGGARTTPGKAVGFLFIPFFNLYWIFVAYLGLAKDWNRIHTEHPNLVGAPRISEGLVVTFCIFTILLFVGRLASFTTSTNNPLAITMLIVWGISFVLELIFLNGVCRLVEFMGRLHLRQAHPAGGLHLY